MTARDDELDDPFIARYADRIDDDTEVLWRADFARLEEDSRLTELQEIEIRARWETDAEVGPRWRELDEIFDAWIFAPEVMKRAHEVTMPGGLRPPDMDSTRWSSHMQAREIAREGYWPGFEPTYSTDSSERHEPMNDITAHVLDSETETDIERQLRTDYERASQVLGADPNEYDPAAQFDADEYASTWLNHEDHRFGDTWVAITEAEHLWQTDHEAAAAKLADTSTAPLQRRTLEQARDMSRGIYARDVEEVIDRVTETADSSSPIPAPAPVERPMTHFENGLPSWDASRNNPARPVPQFAGVAERTSALANYKPGNALAAAMERQFEREGAER
ncbi:hypothetical protein AB0H98_30625 [Nocardia salmonicida]|uniref:hypothetical protein n=1 Tax=Nocardia salmonicida TaxID=53431 RepID=UPI0033F25B32